MWTSPDHDFVILLLWCSRPIICINNMGCGGALSSFVDYFVDYNLLGGSSRTSASDEQPEKEIVRDNRIR